jgi:phage regulator Rha-like protein
VLIRILFLRGKRAIIDSDLAELYGVPAKRLNQQVTRNGSRFPADFRSRLSRTEYKNLRLQFATSSLGHGGRRYLPYAFTEHGAIMAATVLNSERAIQMSIFVVRAFVHMREALATNRQIVMKLAELEGRIENHHTDIEGTLATIRHLMAPPKRDGCRIGFVLPPGSEKNHNRRLLAYARRARDSSCNKITQP